MPGKLSATVEVLSTMPLAVHSKDPDRVVARQTYHDEKHNKYTFVISISDGPTTTTSVEFFSKDTKQKVRKAQPSPALGPDLLRPLTVNFRKTLQSHIKLPSYRKWLKHRVHHFMCSYLQ